MAVNPVYIDQARREILFAPFGHKTAMADKWAAVLNISREHLYREIKTDHKTRKADARKPEYREWTKIIYIIKKRPPEEAGEISTEDAVAKAVQAKLIPEAALSVPVSTFNAIARKLGYTQTQRRISRFQAARPNQAHHFDASTSKCFYIARKAGDEYVLKLHRPAKHYKNKPIPVDSLRPWIYGMADDYSGRHISRYTAAAGESAADSMAFLAYGWANIGLCEKLFADQGMLKKCLASADMVKRLGVELPQMMPYNKEGHGKIERPWRTIWQKFELTFFAVDDWQSFEISMTELNRQLAIFTEDKYNQLPHRFERTLTKMQMWERIHLHGGIVRIPENALATVAQRYRRKVGDDGQLNLNGNIYEVKGLHAAWVHVFEGVFEDRIIVQEIETGKRYEVKDFVPLGIDEYRAHPETPHQKLVNASATITANQTGLYSEAKPKDETIKKMPVRTKEHRKISNPFDVDTYPTMEAALKEFCEIAGGFDGVEDRQMAEQLITQVGMKKQYVTDLALEIRAEIEAERAKEERQSIGQSA